MHTWPGSKTSEYSVLKGSKYMFGFLTENVPLFGECDLTHAKYTMSDIQETETAPPCKNNCLKILCGFFLTITFRRKCKQWHFSCLSSVHL